ncbi:hypothetical protein [Jannaschia sp. 2305UL9-9]|uniref:hypothetical protein n=1 Tax=Jannaschia sp. 2305UL9-9 TaxID=3121638 RepID=UPI00352765E5
MPPLFIITDTDDFTAADLREIIEGAVPNAEVQYVQCLEDHSLADHDIARLVCALIDIKAAETADQQAFDRLRAGGTDVIWIGQSLPRDPVKMDTDRLLQTPFTNESVLTHLAAYRV